ncbi:hypothetical protein ACHWQZ_G013999 [Mnemiopsis leidyi]
MNFRLNLRRLRILVLQLIVVQTTVEMFRVLAVFDCTFDPQALRANIMDAAMVISFMAGIWPIVILLRIDYHRLRRYKCIKKFLVFKVMIAVSKFLAKCLGFVAKRGFIKGTKEMGASQRSLVWCNFATVLIALCLQVISSRLYSYTDYNNRGLCSSQSTEEFPEDEVHIINSSETQNPDGETELFIN